MPRSTSSAPASMRNSNSTQPSAASASPSSCGSPSSTTSAPSSHQTCTTPTVSLSRSDTDPSALHPITPTVPWWAVARDINAHTLWRMHHDVLLATHASKPLTRACAEHLVSFVNLLSGHLSTTIYPQCSVDVECSAADGKTCWPLVRKGGPCTRAVAQTIGSAPLGVMTSWQIRRYAAGSDVNVLLLSPEPLWALERLAAALVSDPTIASCSIRASKQRGVYLHARMLTGMHVGVTVATNEESFDAQIEVRDLLSKAFSERPGLRPVLIVVKNLLSSLKVEDSVCGDDPHMLYDRVLSFHNAMSALSLDPHGMHGYGFQLLLLLSYLIEFNSPRANTTSAFKLVHASYTGTLLDERPLRGLRAKLLDAARLLQMYEAAIEASWRRRLLEKLVSEAVKEIIFIDSLCASGRLPTCSNPADRFTPLLRKRFPEVVLPKHLGKSIYWMGISHKAQFPQSIERCAPKLRLQLEWFPCNNSPFFTKEPGHVLAVDAAAALDAWINAPRDHTPSFDAAAAEAWLLDRQLAEMGGKHPRVNIAPIATKALNTLMLQEYGYSLDARGPSYLLSDESLWMSVSTSYVPLGETDSSRFLINN